MTENDPAFFCPDLDAFLEELSQDKPVDSAEECVKPINLDEIRIATKNEEKVLLAAIYPHDGSPLDARLQIVLTNFRRNQTKIDARWAKLAASATSLNNVERFFVPVRTWCKVSCEPSASVPSGSPECENGKKGEPNPSDDVQIIYSSVSTAKISTKSAKTLPGTSPKTCLESIPSTSRDNVKRRRLSEVGARSPIRPGTSTKTCPGKSIPSTSRDCVKRRRLSEVGARSPIRPGTSTKTCPGKSIPSTSQDCVQRRLSSEDGEIPILPGSSVLKSKRTRVIIDSNIKELQLNGISDLRKCYVLPKYPNFNPAGTVIRRAFPQGVDVHLHGRNAKRKSSSDGALVIPINEKFIKIRPALRPAKPEDFKAIPIKKPQKFSSEMTLKQGDDEQLLFNKEHCYARAPSYPRTLKKGENEHDYCASSSSRAVATAKPDVSPQLGENVDQPACSSSSSSSRAVATAKPDVSPQLGENVDQPACSSSRAVATAKPDFSPQLGENVDQPACSSSSSPRAVATAKPDFSPLLGENVDQPASYSSLGVSTSSFHEENDRTTRQIVQDALDNVLNLLTENDTTYTSETGDDQSASYSSLGVNTTGVMPVTSSVHEENDSTTRQIVQDALDDVLNLLTENDTTNPSETGDVPDSLIPEQVGRDGAIDKLQNPEQVGGDPLCGIPPLQPPSGSAAESNRPTVPIRKRRIKITPRRTDLPKPQPMRLT